MNRTKSGANLTIYAGQHAGDGSIPATPVAMYLRHTTGESLEGKTDSIASTEMLPGRSTAEPMPGNSSSGGSLPIEFSARSYDRLLAATMMANWVQDGVNTKKATLHASNVAKKFWILKYFTEPDYPLWQLFNKVMVDSLDLTFGINAIVKGSFGLIGIDDPALVKANPVTGLSSYPAALTTQAFTARKGYLKIDGVECKYIKECKINLKNNLAAIYALFQTSAIDVKEKLFDVTGSLTTYLMDEILYNKAQAGTKVTLAVEVEDDAGNTYEFAFANVKLTTHTGASAGSADELTPSYNFTAFGSDVVTITRTLIAAESVFTLTYDGNSETSGSEPDPVTKNEAGAVLTVSRNTGKLVKTGKTFGGWNTAADGTSTAYAAYDSIVIEGATTLYAVWN